MNKLDTLALRKRAFAAFSRACSYKVRGEWALAATLFAEAAQCFRKVDPELAKGCRAMAAECRIDALHRRKGTPCPT